MAILAKQDIDSRPFFVPIHELPPYAGAHRRALPVTEHLARRGINLPTSTGLSSADLGRVISAVIDAHEPR